MTKRKSPLPAIGVPTTTPTTNSFLAGGDEDMIYASRRARIIAAFFADKANRLNVSLEEVRKTPLSVNEQLDLQDKLRRMDAGTGTSRYGSYPQEPVRIRHIADHLVRGPGGYTNDAGVRDLPGSDDPNDDHSR